MNTAKIVSSIWFLVCVIAGVGSELMADTSWLPWLPPKVGHAVLGICLVAMWIRGHRNLFINPDGTNAATPYVDPKKTPR